MHSLLLPLHQSLSRTIYYDNYYLKNDPQNNAFVYTAKKETTAATIFVNAMKNYCHVVNSNRLDINSPEFLLTITHLRADGAAFYAKYQRSTQRPLRVIVKFIYAIASFMLGSISKYQQAEIDTKKAYEEYCRALSDPYTCSTKVVIWWTGTKTKSQLPARAQNAAKKVVTLAVDFIEAKPVVKVAQAIVVAGTLAKKGMFRASLLSLMCGTAFIANQQLHTAMKTHASEARDLGKLTDLAIGL